MQEMHGKECEGRFLGVKLDAYAARGARQDMQDVDMEQDTASGNGRPERPAKRSGSHKGRQVVVQGIPFAYAWQDLKDLFKPVGGVKADIVVGQDGRSKGWGTVLFDTPEDAERAIQEMHGTEVEGRHLGVKLDSYA
ncbi:TPA: hypothetical protein ACH3X2_012444 [Trebouxia sp. C0005]|nr:MAG: G-strand telomere binding 1 [Trebouxia sp. A1-2]